MTSSKCSDFMNRALEHGAPSQAWQKWQKHSLECQHCEKNLKILNALHAEPDDEVEGLEAYRVEALRHALTLRKRPRTRISLGVWLMTAAAVAAFVFFLVPKPNQQPFNLIDSPNKWAQIAANPDWDLEAEHPLRKRIKTLRQDFRISKPQNVQQQKSEGLKDRISRLRDTLEKEF